MVSPYSVCPVEDWAEKTKELIKQHPLKPDVIREVALYSWDILWQTKIGKDATVMNLEEINPPATVVGYFFEKLFAKELQKRYPKEWRGTQSKDEKDIVYTKEPKFSIELKTSGQLGTEIFGNRSSGQKVENEVLAKKEKSGYYITVNFHKTTLTLLRIGWLENSSEHSDWKSQSSQTGQASSIKDDAYKHKLFTISGDYLLDAPVKLLCRVGSKTANDLAEEGVRTIRELSQYNGNKKFQKAHIKAEYLHDLYAIDTVHVESKKSEFTFQENFINNVWWLGDYIA